MEAESPLDEEWMEDVRWWYSRTANAVARTPPPSAPATPPRAADSPEARACRTRRGSSGARRQRKDATREPPPPMLRLHADAPRSPQAVAERAQADAQRFAQAVVLLRQARAPAQQARARARAGAALCQHASPALTPTYTQENAALKEQLERALVTREEATAIRTARAASSQTLCARSWHAR
jgi:hypothetical protein